MVMKKNRRRKSGLLAAGQCDSCAVTYCSVSRQQECARQHFMAIAEGTIYECSEFEAGYWQKMCA